MAQLHMHRTSCMRKVMTVITGMLYLKKSQKNLSGLRRDVSVLRTTGMIDDAANFIFVLCFSNVHILVGCVCKECVFCY